MRSCDAALHAENVVLARFELESSAQTVRLGANATPMKVSEETINETFLLELGRYYSDVVQVVSFTRAAEARLSGADWAWHFETPMGAFQMLIQAKRVEEHIGEPPDWHVTLPTSTNEATGKTQHQTLLDAAARLGVAQSTASTFQASVSGGANVWLGTGTFHGGLTPCLMAPSARFI
ncbi:MAG TPA: hypothetical protein VMQ76_13140 [Terracidiphilus sp.]|nr:hypothetical protein [Terracidiphilus sp.]